MEDICCPLARTQKVKLSSQTPGPSTSVTQILLELPVQVLPLSLSKYVGVTKLLEALGLKKENLMALGDGENDIDMLKASTQLPCLEFCPYPSLHVVKAQLF